MIQGRDEDEGCCCGGHEHDASEDCGCGSHEGGCCGDHEGHGDGCGGHGHEGGHSHEGGCCGHHGGGCCGGGCGHNASDDQIRMFIVGPIETDCYAYVSEGECLVVDPGNSGAAIARHLEDVRVTTIVATHGHGDHVGGVKALRDATGARFLMHEADVELAGRAGEASELGRSYDDDAPEPDQTIADGDVIELGTASFRVIGAPATRRAASCSWARGRPMASPSWATPSSRAPADAPTSPAATTTPSWPLSRACGRRYPPAPRSSAAMATPPP